ncbi:MAG: DUF5686 family protein, partial [Chitinophagales bacterium]
VNDDANKKDTTYWQQHRPVPLTMMETTDYHRKDSIYTVHNSKSYLDSIDRKANNFNIKDFFFGYNYGNRFHHLYYEWSNPLLGLSFNTVEGFNITLRNSLRKDFPDEVRSWKVISDVRYGFSDHQLKLRGSFEYKNHPIHHQQWLLGAGIYPTQINEDEPIYEIVNAVYSLIATENFMKLYEKKFLSAQHVREWFNGFRLTSTISYADRIPLPNASDYSFDVIGQNQYSPNNFFTNEHADSITHTQALTFGLRAAITIGQHYITRPTGRFATSSKFPTFIIEYKKGIHAFASEVNFDVAEVSTAYQLNLGLFGTSEIYASVGSFINRKAISLIDFKHFKGNQTIFGTHYQNGFQLLPYYSFSTDQSWLEGHYEHHFRGFILNKIPLIKKLNLQEVGGAHLLLTNDISYFEVDVGIEHLFKFLRVDFISSFIDTGKIDAGFLIGVSMAINVN